MKIPSPEEMQHDPFGSHLKISLIIKDYEQLKQSHDNLCALIRGIVREEIQGLKPAPHGIVYAKGRDPIPCDHVFVSGRCARCGNTE